MEASPDRAGDSWHAAVHVRIGRQDAATMLVADVGATGLWIALITVGIAMVVIGQVRGDHGLHS